MYERFQSELETSRRKLLSVAPPDVDVTFIRIFGNIGDDLIYAGTRQLLRDVTYREISVHDVAHASGTVAIVAGGGSWCDTFHLMPGYLKAIQRRFEQVVVFPSSFDVSVPIVKEALMGTRALIFARENESYAQIRNLCRAELAHDAAFFFDYSPYQRRGQGILNAFRTDPEALPLGLPPDNNDISVTCQTLDEWLWTIARHDAIQTDRTHVTIAAALLGKRVRFRPSNYHKLPAIVEYALSECPVEQLPASAAARPQPTRPLRERGVAEPRIEDWPGASEHVARELARLAPSGSVVVLLDDGTLDLPQLVDREVIPFTERAGHYWGPPPDDETALRELKRLLEMRPAVVAVAWPSFWWLTHYPELRKYLETTFPCVHHDDRLIAFDLRCAVP